MASGPPDARLSFTEARLLCGIGRVVIGARRDYFPHVKAADSQLIVHEIYASLQGESSYAGRPCVFVRLTGCNLRCSYCDTEYAFSGGERMSVDKVVAKVTGYGIPLVEITGGEPLLQQACVTLAQRLVEANLTVLIETSGERPIHGLPPGVIRIMDVKCPSSGECEKMNWDNIAHLNANDEVKFVIGDRADYDWALEIIRKHDLSRTCAVLISTVFGKIDAKDVAQWMIEDKLNARFQLQMHKYIWSPETRGV